jgi:hypothetical protein
MVNKAFTRERGCPRAHRQDHGRYPLRDAIADDRADLRGLPVSKEQVVLHR